MKEFLSRNNVRFTERNIAADSEALADLERLGYHTTPVTVIDGTAVVGFEPARLNTLLRLE